MVESISPAYYAIQTDYSIYRVDLVGRGFSLIPDDAIGIASYDNEDPLQNRYSDEGYNLQDVIVESDGSMYTQYISSHRLNENMYLGAIVSNDRETVYWVNETRPLP